MPRRLRVQFSGAIYHVTIRGNGRKDIFGDDHDRERFLQRLTESMETYGVRLYLFCLMNNHVHLVLETPQGNLSRIMQSVETGYTVYYNIRHNQPGHVMQGRYSAKLVEGNEYLLNLSRYVHLNPVFTKQLKDLSLKERIRTLRNYRWSSYPGYAGIGREFEMVTSAPILELTGANKNRQRQYYRKYVESGLTKTDEEFLAVLRESHLCIGDENFQARMSELYQKLVENSRKPEDIAFRKQMGKISTETILGLLSKKLKLETEQFKERKRKSALRPLAAMLLRKYGGLTNRNIAKVLNIGTGAAAGRAITRLEHILETNRELKMLLPGIEEELTIKAKTY
jgi:putative transposase